MEALSWQLTIDANDPHAQADFWAAALHAKVEDNSEMIDAGLAQGWAQQADVVVHHDRHAWRDLVAVRGRVPGS